MKYLNLMAKGIGLLALMLGVPLTVFASGADMTLTFFWLPLVCIVIAMRKTTPPWLIEVFVFWVFFFLLAVFHGDFKDPLGHPYYLTPFWTLAWAAFYGLACGLYVREHYE